MDGENIHSWKTEKNLITIKELIEYSANLYLAAEKNNPCRTFQKV